MGGGGLMGDLGAELKPPEAIGGMRERKGGLDFLAMGDLCYAHFGQNSHGKQQLIN